MTRDDQPMLAIHANGVALARRFGNVPPFGPADPKPWHSALVVWWRFIARRKAMDTARLFLRANPKDGAP